MALKEGYIDVQRQPVAKLKANCKIAGIKTEWTTMKCVMFIHFPLDVLNAGKSGVQVQLENEIDLMSSLRHPGTLRLLYDIKHMWMHVAGIGVML